MIDHYPIGFISQQHTIWCGICPEWDQLSGAKKDCLRAWLMAGWERNKTAGYICPKCKEKSCAAQ